MRLHPDDCTSYSELKHELASKYRNDRKLYVAGKEGLIWEIMRKTDRWAQKIGWVVGPSDF